MYYENAVDYEQEPMALETYQPHDQAKTLRRMAVIAEAVKNGVELGEVVLPL